MRKLLLSFGALLVLSGCGTFVDRGTCLASHTEHQDGYTYLQPMSFDGGKTTTLMPQYVPDSDTEVCDRWEFPDGRPQPKATRSPDNDAGAAIAGIAGQM